MTRPRTTYGKRAREQQKREKAKAKADRRLARQHEGDAEEPGAPVGSSEAELVEELATLHQDFQEGRVDLEELEERQELIRERLQRLQG